MDNKNLKQYEISFLTKDENGAASVISNIKRFGGEISDEGELGEVKLSYPMKRQNSAYFGCIHAEIPPEVISDINESLKLDDGVLRFLIVSPPFGRGGYERDSSQGTVKVKENAEKETSRPKAEGVLSNDLLEEKLEEILK